LKEVIVVSHVQCGNIHRDSCRGRFMWLVKD